MPTISAAPIEPRSRDADRSQAIILNAARNEFAEHGLGGARVDRIAERAGLNKRLIYYYFDDLEKLFQAVLEQAYLHIREAEHKLNLLAQKPADAIRSLVEFTWNYYLQHPEFLTLLNSANLHRARHLEASQSVREMNSPLIATLGEILERGRKDGSFRGGIDQLQLYVSIAGLSYFYLSNNYTLSAIFGRDLMTPKSRSERLSHICEVTLACELNAACLVLVVGGLPGALAGKAAHKDIALSRNQVTDGIAALLDYAKANNMPLAIETLHPMYAFERACINTMEHALNVCDALNPSGGSALGAAVDVYHVAWDPKLEAQIKRAGKNRLLAFHVCDWLTPTTDLLNDWGMMGDGVIDIPQIRGWVEAEGFAGYSEVEIFSINNW